MIGAILLKPAEGMNYAAVQLQPTATRLQLRLFSVLVKKLTEKTPLSASALHALSAGISSPSPHSERASAQRHLDGAVIAMGSETSLHLREAQNQQHTGTVLAVNSRYSKVDALRVVARAIRFWGLTR